MEKFSYAGLLILFLTPVIYILLKKHTKTIKKRKLLLFVMGIYGFLGFFTFPLAVWWNVWLYNYAKTSNIRIGGELLETFLWTIISCMILAVVVDVFAEKEEKKKPFWPL